MKFKSDRILGKATLSAAMTYIKERPTRRNEQPQCDLRPSLWIALIALGRKVVAGLSYLTLNGEPVGQVIALEFEHLG